MQSPATLHPMQVFCEVATGSLARSLMAATKSGDKATFEERTAATLICIELTNNLEQALDEAGLKVIYKEQA